MRSYSRVAAVLSLWSVLACSTAGRQGSERSVRELQDEIVALQLELQEALVRQDAALALPGEESVNPGINDTWKSPDIEPLIARLEDESREVYNERHRIAAVVGVPPGSDVADVGAGSGFLAELFASQVGAEGTVYAVDINPVLVDEVAERAKERGLTNLKTVVCGDRSVGLEPASVDLVFVCDTYHHFEYPRNSLRSIWEALRPDGQLVVVDFQRIPGLSEEWILDHVRAGEEVFTAEIESAGFRLIGRHDLPDLEQNYILRFQKTG